MSSHRMETIELGELKASSALTTVFAVPNIAASMVVTMYDMVNKIGAIAHVILPDSTINAQSSEQEGVAKYANLAVPALLKAYTDEGGEVANALVCMVGGAQLFNFGGGSGNVLNIGARNAVAIKTALSRQALTVDKEDIGGNKPRSLTFALMDGKITVKAAGGQETVI